ncbi:MAG: hypothetical protein HQK97_09190 [Nitrospirae bacterium]|nr:hypothetical protein [Nitrospirota bacterium]
MEETKEAAQEDTKEGLEVIEYFDPIRQANISIVTKAVDGVAMVQAISFCFKDNPFPLGQILNVETKTFISMPPGFRGIPVLNSIPADDPIRQPKKDGCGGCGKGSQSTTIEVDLEVK